MTPQSGIQRRKSDESLLLLMLVVYFNLFLNRAGSGQARPLRGKKKGVAMGGKETFFFFPES